ncbi:Dolichyl-diphosphooligosaccharide--protein glycosyltransferase subunit 2 [Trichinella pseudospiralis]|uniref:Dolichyl-diphosphooligosaccharide--protein glycosyltransferase subunit 2 n=1 Tax=Trichinella pseudospiralis TaxID=6337 RepID=A0A0V1JQL4_TRIPS|nr:Dolichyl-diphosphooligosaccharide--protein glycosyltransferase subunit 2 [Trichinella pseudospiralis]
MQMMICSFCFKCILRAVIICCIVNVGNSMILTEVMTESDVAAAHQFFLNSISKQSSIESLAWVANGLKTMNKKIPDDKAKLICESAKEAVKNTSEIQPIYWAAFAVHALENCQLPSFPSNYFDKYLFDKSNAKTVAYAVSSIGYLKVKYDMEKMRSVVSALVKRSTSPNDRSVLLNTAPFLSGDLKFLTDCANDLVSQVDESDERYLRFDGGIGTTASIVHAIYQLSVKTGNPVALKKEQILKFANYLISRRRVYHPRVTSLIFSVLHDMTNDKVANLPKNSVPLAILLEHNGSLDQVKSSIQFMVTDIFGHIVPTDRVIADKIVHISSKEVVMNSKPFSRMSAKGNAVYELKFVDEKRKAGFYECFVSVGATNSKYMPIVQEGIVIKVSREIYISGLNLAIHESERFPLDDKAESMKINGKKLMQLSADDHQKLAVIFVIKDKLTKESILVDQAYLQFEEQNTKTIITVPVANDNANVYKADIDFKQMAKDYEFTSGMYEISLIVGDDVIMNSVIVKLALLNLQLPAVVEHAGKSVLESTDYKMKPEIVHSFRPPEKRPPKFISDIFSVAVVIPFFLLLCIWFYLGANIWGIPFSPVVIVFHAGLGGIFWLYYQFWVHLNMFETLKYLGILGTITFLSGISVLRKRADRINSLNESCFAKVNGEVVSSIQRGICALIGLSRDDDANDIEYIVRKLLNLRIFTGDAEKRWDKSVNDLQLEILCVSQFTVNALLKGNKLDFHLSMNPSEAAQFYCTFVDKLRQNYREDLVKGFLLFVDVMSSKSSSGEEFMVICYPGIVKNVDKALESLGGMKEIEKHKAGSLELNFHRKSNVFSRPALSRHREGAFLIIRARRLIQASPSSSEQATYSVQLEVVGTLSSIHDFNSSLFDFQYLPMRKNEDGQYSEIYSALVPSTKEQAERWFTAPIPDPELFLIPFSFTRLCTVSETILSREVTSYDLETPGRTAESVRIGDCKNLKCFCLSTSAARKNRRTYTRMAAATDEFPAEPSPLAMKQVKRNTFDPAVHEALEKAFSERPMWLKYSLIVKLKLDERDVRRLLPKFAFHIISGPWGRNWCRYKYDPREDTNSWKFQTMHFPFFRFGGESALSDAFVKWHLKVSSVGIRSSKEWDKLLTTEPAFEYTEGCLPPLRSMWYQMCDIHLPAVKELLSHRLRENQTESHPTDGWLKSGTLDEIRELIKLDFKKTIDTLNAQASQSKADESD